MLNLRPPNSTPPPAIGQFEGVSLPLPPDTRCIQWSWGKTLTIAAVFGDFSATVGASTNTNSAGQKLESILGQTLLQEIFDHLSPFLESRIQPSELNLELKLRDRKQFIRLETVIQFDDCGQAILFSYWRDITELKRSLHEAELLTQVINSIPSWIFLKNMDHDYEMVNSSYAAFYGTTPDQCIGKNSVDLGVPKEVAVGCEEKGILGFWAVDDEVFQTGEPKETLSEPIVVGEETRFLQTLKTPIVNPHSDQPLLVGFCHDITYLKEVETRIGIELRHNKTLNRVGDTLRSFENFTEAAQESVCEVLIDSLHCCSASIELADSSPIKVNVSDCAPATKQSVYEVAIAGRGTLHGKLTAIFNDDSESLDKDIQALLSEVGKKLAIHTHRQHLIAEINFRANHDSLTDLPNRLSFSNALEDAILLATLNQRVCAVVLMDLDGFKQINDSMGHHVGDELLLAVAQRLNGIALANETPARLGGDEFAILVQHIDCLEEAYAAADRYLKEMRRPFAIDGRSLNIGASFGVSCSSDECSNITSLLQHADSAMYYAKASGRNSCQPYTQSLAKKTNERLRLQRSLLLAIIEDTGELFLVYQPKFDLSTNRAVGVEVLVRWQHPELGLISPGVFVPLAEESGLILQLGDWIRRRAFETVAQWNRELDTPVSLSLNITPPELEQFDMVNRLLDSLYEAQLNPCCLDLELTETFIMNQFEEVSERLSALRREGVTVSIDDFGSGYSCMSYLHLLPVDCLKVDQSFVKGLDFPVSESNPQRVAIPQAIITMANSFGLKTVAEGIETQYQLDHVVAMGADFGQGFFLDRPMSPQQALEIFKTQCASG